MKVAVLGAGIAGLTAAYRLATEGHSVDVYERWPGLGGQVATLPIEGGDPLERYYHHLFTSDRHIAELYERLGFAEAIEWLPSSVGVLSGGVTHPFTSPLDLLRFSPLPPSSRIRIGLAALRARRIDPVDVDDTTVHAWVAETMGEPAWERLWGPLVRGKFGSRADRISAAWLACKLGTRRSVRGAEARREVLGYPRGGWQPLLDRLAVEIASRGSRVLIDRPATRIARRADGRLEVTGGTPGSFRRGHDPREFPVAHPPEPYDRVLATVPGDVFVHLLDPGLAAETSPGYLAQVSGIEYQTALCLLLELDRRFGDFYWTNVADDGIPFVGLIEQANLVGAERYGGRRFLYVANYVEPGDPLLSLTPDELIDSYLPGLRTANPDFSASWILERRLFREPAAQPLITAGYARRIPPLLTGADGLVLANTTQIYPEDRGTNYSVELGTRAARLMSETERG